MPDDSGSQTSPYTRSYIFSVAVHVTAVIVLAVASAINGCQCIRRHQKNKPLPIEFTVAIPEEFVPDQTDEPKVDDKKPDLPDDPEAIREPEPEKPKAARPQLSAEDQKAFDNLATTAGMFKAEYQQAVKELGITAKQLTLSPANVEIAKKIMAKVNEIVGKQQ